jgi:tripartite-type tricarboxylate transporter receptor subunit TctC
MIMDKPLKMVAAFLVLAGTALAVCAQYPAKPVRLIVPFPSGGAAELTARIYAQPLGPGPGQPVVIETKPGGDGVIGSRAQCARGS